MSARVRVLLSVACAATMLCGCATDASPDVLVVRHPLKACALVWFSGCGALQAEPARAEQDAEDAGVEREDASVDAERE